MSVPRQIEPHEPIPAPKSSPLLRQIAWGMVGAGAALSLAALASATTRPRFAFAYLWAFSFIWSVALGTLFFVAVHHLVRAAWSVVIRRVAELFAAPMWLVGVLFVPLLCFCLLHDQFLLYPWLDHGHSAHDHLLEGKRAYLNLPFFTLRAAAFFGIWIAFARYFVGHSLRQDVGEGGVEATRRMRRMSAPFVMLFAFTASFAGIDWLMSLEPLWFSTMFGVYLFSGIALTALAVITMATIRLRATGQLGQGNIGERHLYHLGTLMFAFVCFWGYIAFSQYMLIWYGNMPEESFYMVQRLEGGWLPVSIALALVRFVIPFLALLSRGAKTDPTRLTWVSAWLILGQLLDLYWLIMPQLHSKEPAFGWPELGPLLLLTGAMTWYVAGFLTRHRPLPVGDPLFVESQQLHI